MDKEIVPQDFGTSMLRARMALASSRRDGMGNLQFFVSGWGYCRGKYDGLIDPAIK